MSCDIHVFCEKYNHQINKWENLSLYTKSADGSFEARAVYDGRSYDLFGLLAGVRGPSVPFVPDRGLPDDLSEEVERAWASGEGCWHTPTWYDYCELLAYLRFVEQRDLYLRTKIELDALKEDSDECCDEPYYLPSSPVLREFLDTIEYVFESYGIYYPKPNTIRIVMWFDN